MPYVLKVWTEAPWYRGRSDATWSARRDDARVDDGYSLPSLIGKLGNASHNDALLMAALVPFIAVQCESLAGWSGIGPGKPSYRTRVEVLSPYAKLVPWSSSMPWPSSMVWDRHVANADAGTLEWVTDRVRDMPGLQRRTMDLLGLRCEPVDLAQELLTVGASCRS